MPAAARPLEELLARLAPPALLTEAPLPTGLCELDAMLPGGGLPRGVVELSSARGLGGSTSVALAAVRSAQARDERALCAWLDPDATLFGPGALRAGVVLDRLLVVRPPLETLPRIAVKVAKSRIFELIVIDLDAETFDDRCPPQKAGWFSPRPKGSAKNTSLLVRRLALAAEAGRSTIVLVTRRDPPRPAPLPVALRLELQRPSPHELMVRIGKDRHGRVGATVTVPFQPLEVLRTPSVLLGALG